MPKAKTIHIDCLGGAEWRKWTVQTRSTSTNSFHLFVWVSLCAPRMPSGGFSDWAGSLAVALSVPKDIYLAKLHLRCANESLTSHLEDSGVVSSLHKPDLGLLLLLLDFNNHLDCPHDVFSCLTLINALFPSRCGLDACGHVCPYWWICVITDGMLWSCLSDSVKHFLAPLKS